MSINTHKDVRRKPNYFAYASALLAAINVTIVLTFELSSISFWNWVKDLATFVVAYGSFLVFGLAALAIILNGKFRGRWSAIALALISLVVQLYALDGTIGGVGGL